jgi:hypothetical protein
MFLSKFYSLACVLISVTLPGASLSLDIAAPQPYFQPRSTCPGVYDIGLGTVRVVHHRALVRDSIYIGATLVVITPGDPTYNISNFYGKHRDGHFNSSITFSNISVPDEAVAVLGYVILNIGHHSEASNLNLAQNAAYTYTTSGVNALPGGIAPSPALAGIAGQIPKVGLVLSNVIKLLQGCDAIVAAGLHLFSGDSMCAGSSNFTTLVGTDIYYGGLTSDPACDVVHSSQYHVGFFAGSTENLNMTTVYSENGGGRLVVAGGLWWAVGLGLLTFVLL